MRIFILVLLLVASLKAEDFITKMEYAKMLYSNPRGIGCILCHGKKGEGSTIATYKHRGKSVKLEAPSINSLSLERFFKAFKNKSSVMPKYFLTDTEIETLHFYVTSEADK